ncbi:MAG: iron ABC transporter permease [Treponema sp.]|nr:iron ABC transporter permease [Treponema sp.]
MTNNKRITTAAIASCFVIIAGASFGSTTLGSSSLGSSGISLSETFLIILNKIFNIPADGIDPKNISIVWMLRLPRVLLAFIAGGSLAVSGAVCQSALRNPLASPYILGVSSGASLGVGIFIVGGISIPLMHGFELPFAGLIFGFVTVFFVAALSSRLDKSMANNTVILCGMIISLFLNAALMILSAIFSDDIKRIVLWQMGSFSMRGWAYIQLLLPFTVIGIIGIFRYSREMDIISLSDDLAKTCGVETGSLRKKLLLFTAILSGTTVAACGVIGFVDLITPHIARKITGSRHKALIPMSFLLGGSLMVLADLAARTVISPSELPVGAVTALIGVPFFMAVFFKGRKCSK